CVAMMTCRTAVLGAFLNVRINLASIKDKRFVKELSEKCNRIEKETLRKEQELTEFVRGEMRSEK
ncbi:MAG: Formiminotetrahydrofolate cyclodeaminase, partial [Methermicoccus sp.]|nr:Formiminotetrahydrofolate cyclodeaminase [Methermicoccus sp.]